MDTVLVTAKNRYNLWFMVCCSLGTGKLQFMVRLTTTVAYAMLSHGLTAATMNGHIQLLGKAYASFWSCSPDYES